MILFRSAKITAMAKGCALALPLLFSCAATNAEPDPNEVGAQPRGVPTVAEGIAAWNKVLIGDDLSAGKEVQFFPAPDYHLTLDENDKFDLTDGKLASKNNDRIWFHKEAVGWYLAAGDEVSLMVDLGKEEEVGRVAIRVLGGREQGSLVFPKGFEILASNDGRQFYSVSAMQKLQPAESDLSDFKSTFYLPEEHKAYVYPFAFDANVKARYIVIRMTRDAGIFTDELSIRRVLQPGTARPLTAYQPARFFTEGVVVLPRKEPMVITENVITPNFFLVQDNTGGKANNADFVIEVPAGIELVAATMKFESQPANRAGWNRYRVDMGRRSRGRLDPLYFKVTDKAKVPANATCRITARIGGTDSNTVEIPLRIVAIPEVNTHGVLDVSLTWMNEGNAAGWPEFLDNFRKLGFDYVSAFPRWYRGKDGKMWLEAPYDVGLTGDDRYEEVLRSVREGSASSLSLLDAARRQNFRIIANDSPFHIMEKALNEALKNGKVTDDEKREIFNVVDGKIGKHVSPLYRGRFFQNELLRLKSAVELTRPDELYLDIEWWYESVDESQKDERVVTAWKASGKTWEDFRSDMGTAVLREVKKAADEAAQNAGIAPPKIGLYGAHASGPQVQKFFEFSKLYPRTVQYSMPSLYVQGRTSDVIAKIRADYAKLGNRDIIPWLTAGTYGEFDPERMETMVLESILNGARGVTYYSFYDFDPMDFYYHVKALSLLMKYPQLLKRGKPRTWTGSNANLNYTAFGDEKEVLLLVGNYKRSPDTRCTVSVPLAQVKEVRNVATGELLKPEKELRLNVAPGEFVLLHARS
jgi:hypothetical protein